MVSRPDPTQSSPRERRQSTGGSKLGNEEICQSFAGANPGSGHYTVTLSTDKEKKANRNFGGSVTDESLGYKSISDAFFY